MNTTPHAWCAANRQWRRVDNINHAKFKMRQPGANIVFWRSVLELLGVTR